MDAIDQLILALLQEDGRLPFTEIARQVGVSETTVRSRYRNLTTSGVARTVSVVDPFALGYQAPAILGIKVEPGMVESVADALTELPEVSYLVLTLGSFDLMVEVFCPNAQHLSQLITKHIHPIPGVKEIEPHLISRSYKLSYRWPLQGENE